MEVGTMNSYNNYMQQNVASVLDEKNATTIERKEKAANGSSDISELSKLAPSVKMMFGNSIVSSKSGKTLTINPQLVNKMQNNPSKKKETIELIKGVESMMNIMESINKASGWTCVYKHSYIDENGKFHSIGQYRNDFMLNLSDKLREERRENSEKLIEKSKEKAEKKEHDEKTDEKSEGEIYEVGYSKSEDYLIHKITESKNGLVYLYDEDIKAFIEAINEDNSATNNESIQEYIGVNLDIKI